MNQKHPEEFSEPDRDPGNRFHENHVELAVFNVCAEFRAGQPDHGSGQDQRHECRAVFQHHLKEPLRRAVALEGVRHQDHAHDQKEQQKTEDIGTDGRTASQFDYG
ncbi:hypothetical protein SDC9_183710 [bioreactor metagenome]|uniref:Uncharacterized protein n=1 Tax=bioreactor metagenome TaxID=1076179 RepID=A0A645HCV6_9ZZZZ